MAGCCWTERELQTLQESYGTIPYYDIPSLLPKRSMHAIRAKARELGVKADRSLSSAIRRAGFRAHSLNYEYFANLTRENCYWGGFIAADGCIRMDPTPRLMIKLSRKDHNHLSLLSRAIGFTGDIKQRVANCKGRQFDVSSLSMSVHNDTLDDLKKWFSITERKSLTLKPPRLTKTRHIAAFIVGYIDGDGSISYSPRNHSFRLGIRGTMDMLTWIKATFDGWFPTDKGSNVCISDGYPKYAVSGQRLMAVARTLIAHSPVTLDRKWSQIAAKISG